MLLKHITNLQIRSENERYESYLFADELQQSSNNLTKMVRLYVITGDPQYRQYFYEILAIRSGEVARPQDYHQIYWDLVEEGVPHLKEGSEKKSLKARMLEHGFTLNEFNLLQESENASNALAKMEEQAMYAMEGRYDDGTGKYTIRGDPDPKLARKLVFSKEYREAKRTVMLPLEKFFESIKIRTNKRTKMLRQEVVFVITLAISLSALSIIVMVISIYKALNALYKATNDSEMLLLNILPPSIAQRLKRGEEPIVDEIPQASVLFADIVDFTKATAHYGVTKMVGILNELFDEFDTLTEKFGVEKVKTIGDNYMAVSGVPIPEPDHAIKLANFAIELLETFQSFCKSHELNFEARIGMTYGSVIAGVIGRKKFIYDIWGEVVNTASRMESSGVNGKIQITEKMAMMLSEKFEVEKRGEIEVKGIGKMTTFFLIGRKEIR